MGEDRTESLILGGIAGGLVSLLLREKPKKMSINTKYERIDKEVITSEKVISRKFNFAVIHFLGDGEPIAIEITKDGFTRTVYGDYETIEIVAGQEVTIRMIPFPPGEIQSLTPTIEIIELIL